MSEYMKDAGHRPMQTCDRCHGAFYCDAPVTDDAPDWTCPRCAENSAEIASLRAALKPFANIALRIPHMSNEGAALVSVGHLRAALKALEGE